MVNFQCYQRDLRGESLLPRVDMWVSVRVLSVVVRHTVALWRGAAAVACSDLIQTVLAADLVRLVVQRSQLRISTLAGWPDVARTLSVVVQIALLLLGSHLLRSLHVIDLLELRLAEVLHAQNRVALCAATVILQAFDRHHGGATGPDHTVMVERSKMHADLGIHFADADVWRGVVI